MGVSGEKQKSREFYEVQSQVSRINRTEEHKEKITEELAEKE